MMVVFLVLLLVYNVTAYLSGDKFNMIAIIFGPRGAETTQPSEQSLQPSAPAQSVKESQELEAAAQNVGQTAETKAAEPSAQAPATVVQETQKAPETQAPAQTQNVQSQPQVLPAQTAVVTQASYRELDTQLFYRDDPFKPVVVPVKVTAPPVGGFPVIHPVIKGPCGSLVATSFPDSPFIWPAGKSDTPSGGGLPPLPGLEGSGESNLEKAPSSGGGLKLTGIIFDSQPVALIRFDGKNVNVRMNQWVGNCRVLVISRNQVVLSEPNGKQRRLFL